MNPFPSPGQGQNDLKFDNLSRDELKKIEKSMKKPQFMGLLNEYMIEISDPKNKQEYDQYLRQMQSEGELPKNMKLVELSAEFCLRTNIVSEKNKKHNMKFFINYCSTNFIQQPVSEPIKNSDGKVAYGWKVPNSMGKIRYDQDRTGNPCQVADVAFNNKCFEIIEAENNMPFRKNQFKSMIISIGLESAEKQLGQRKETLSKDYDILKNLKCKGGKPALLPLRYIKGKAYNKGEGPQQSTIERSNEGRQTRLEKQINQQKQKHDQQKLKKDQQENQMQEQLEEKKVLVRDMQQGIQRPKYSTIYTYPVDYSEFMQDPVYMKTSKVPSHFTVEFKIPRVENLEQVGSQGLNVNENRIVLKVPEKYFIDLPFQTFKMKYKLLTNKIKAKFDKKKKVLRIIIEIDQSIKYFQEQSKSEIAKQPQIIEQNQIQNIVPNQTWKNKILEVSEPVVDLRVIEKKDQQIEETQLPKKLIEELDQDDQNEEQKNKNETQINKQPLNFEEAIEHQKSKAFSLRSYFNKKQLKTIDQSIKQIIEPNILPYVFQQTNDRVIFIIKMVNYKTQDVEITYNQCEKNDFFVCWNINGKDQLEVELSKIHLLNLRIKEEFLQEIKSVEIVFRIGFLAIFVNKAVLNRFWEKTCVEQNKFAKDQMNQSKYENFKKLQTEVKTFNEQLKLRNQIIEEKQREKQKTNENIVCENNENLLPNQLQQKQAIKQSEAKRRQISDQVNNSNDIDDLNEQNKNIQESQKQKQQGEYFDFNNLPPQFINFDLKFVQAID